MDQFESFLLGKEGEASGTHLMPNAPCSDQGKTTRPSRTIKKVAGEDGFHVDTTGKEAPRAEPEKRAQHYALPSCDRYPLDSYADVKTASVYYVENWRQMAPTHRHEFCVNLQKRASALGIDTPVAGDFNHYSSETYGSQAQLERAVDARAYHIKEAHLQDALRNLHRLQPTLDPEDFAVALGEFDKVASIDHLYDEHLLDPYASTFGTKVAEEGATVVGNDYLSHGALKNFALSSANQLEGMFGDDFVKEFRKDPVAIFKSMPDAQKKVIARVINMACSDPTPT